MNLKGIGAILTLTATLLLGFTFVGPVEAQYPGYGPATPEMKLFYYADETALYSAVKAGSIDLSLWEATSAQYRDAITDPNLVLAPVSRLDMRAFSLNNNFTLATYGPNVRSATSYADFRKALWAMVDRAYYTEVICGGFATPVYVMVSAPSRAWVNVTVENYVKTAWAFSVQTAANLLEDGGFAQIPGDTNPNYKANVPGSAQNWRGYPAGHSKAGQRVDPIVFVARVDDGLRYAASIHLRDRMLESGIQVNFLSMPSSSAFIKVMTARDYQIYSAGWTTGRFATYSWSWYHTSRWVPGGSNYHVSTTSGYDLKTPGTGRPEDVTDLDVEASKVWYPPGLADAITAAKNVQSMSTLKYATFIPLWGGKAFFYYRNLYGVTNQDGVGPENTYTFQSIVRADGGSTIRVGHKSPPTQVNQIYSSWVWDVTTMGQTQDGVYNLEPYNILNEQPGLAQDWTNAPGGPSAVPGTWVDPDTGTTKSMMTYWFLDDPVDGLGDKDAEWIKAGTPAQGGGSVLADFTPHWLGGGYEFNSWYFDTEAAGWIYAGYRDIKHIVPNLATKSVDVYFDVSSYWSYQWPWGRHIYSDQPASVDHTVLGWKSSPLSTQETRTFAGPISKGTYLSLPTRTAGTPVEIIQLKIDGVVQTKATSPHLYNPTTGLGAGGDYSIVGNSGSGPRIRIFKNVATSLEVTYWARGQCAGYWPGNTNFQTTLIGTGQYYMTDFLAGAGGWATYKANPHNYMQTAPPGEIDWYYYWVPGTQPRAGHYALDLYDASYASAALGGSANYIPTANWLSSSDLTSPIGATDVSDIGIMAASYGAVFSSTP